MPVTVTPAGLPVSAWEPTVGGAPRRRVEELAPAGTRLVAVSAHPDDETLGAGRLVSQWVRAVGPVVALALTAGEACLDEVGGAAPGLAERRLGEWHEAIACLGATAGPHAICPDGAVAEHLDTVTAVITAATRPGDVVLATWRGDPHPDHRAAGHAAAGAAERSGAALLEYAVWAPYWLSPADVTASGATVTVVPTDAEAEEQRDRALAAYVSQREPLHPGLGPVVPPLLLEHHHAQLLVG